MFVQSEYIRDLKLGGAMVWALDLDDFNDICSGGSFAFLSTINEVLASSEEDIEDVGSGVDENSNTAENNSHIINMTPRTWHSSFPTKVYLTQL